MVKAVIAHAARLAEHEDDDVRRAYFYAEEKRDTFVELPDNVPAKFRATHIGKLRKALYGTRPAAASWEDELRKGLVSCCLTVGTVSRCCFRNESCTVAGTVHGDDIFVAGPRQDVAKMGTTLKKSWETRDQMIGPRPDDQKELYILNRMLRWCQDGLVFAANLRHGGEVVDELGLSKSKPVWSPTPVGGPPGCQDGELKSLGEEEKHLFHRTVAKVNYLAHHRLDQKYATSCLASAVSSPSLGDVQAAKRVGRFLRKALVAWQGFPFHDPGPGFAAITSGTRSWGTQSELKDLGHSCSVTVATDSQSVIDHSRRRGHSVASKHVGLTGLWLQEVLVDGKPELEKVETATNPADVGTKALPGDRIGELCRRARVYVCCSEEIMGGDPNEWYLSRLDELCRRGKFVQSCNAESEGAC